MDREASSRGRRVRRSVNEMLKQFYEYWVRRFEQDSEQLLDRVTRLARAEPYSSQFVGKN
jgi:hypothetical protein